LCCMCHPLLPLKRNEERKRGREGKEERMIMSMVVCQEGGKEKRKD
jgi:hypothetical protein